MGDKLDFLQEPYLSGNDLCYQAVNRTGGPLGENQFADVLQIAKQGDELQFVHTEEIQSPVVAIEEGDSWANNFVIPVDKLEQGSSYIVSLSLDGNGDLTNDAAARVLRLAVGVDGALSLSA
jgi:hypothetical protein